MGIETIALLAGAAATGYSAYSASQTAKKQMAAQKAIKPPEKPQTAKAPDRTAIAAANAAMAGPGGAMSGNAGTFLTGPSGIDPSTLNLGRNTLLGQ